MALYHLSGDEMGKAKKKTKAPKTKKKKVAKVALVPARASTIAVIELNLLRTGTKLARVWNKPGGKEKLISTWKNIGGDPDKLKKAIAKGSKQSLGAQMGIVAATAIATATPVLIILAKVISEFKGGGDDKEQKEFDGGIDQGKKDLANDPDVEKKDQDMPIGGDVALVKPKPGGGETPLSMGTNPGTICFIIPMLIMMLGISHPVISVLLFPVALFALIGWFFVPGYEMSGTYGNISRKYFNVPAGWFNSLVNKFSYGK